jgi:SAM-dependent methyltransferase
MLGMDDKFIYFQCSTCGCVQIVESPKTIEKYYPPNNYYSFHLSSKRNNNFIRTIFIRLLVRGRMHGIISENLRYVRQFNWLPALKNVNKQAKILDIGCGNGYILKEMRLWGFKNLTGIDPFVEKEIDDPTGIKVYKQFITEHDGKYDVIIMIHSFEHMDNPFEVLSKCYKLLVPDGLLLICIPVSDSFAYRKYGVHWYQLDAPRHFFLHTTRSISLLAKSSGFIIEDISYNSKIEQFLLSEEYQRYETGLKTDRSYRRKKKLEKFTKLLNTLKDGDQACFTFRKIDLNSNTSIDKNLI